MRTARQQARLDRAREVLKRTALTREQIHLRFGVKKGCEMDRFLRNTGAVRVSQDGEIRYRVGA